MLPEVVIGGDYRRSAQRCAPELDVQTPRAEESAEQTASTQAAIELADDLLGAEFLVLAVSAAVLAGLDRDKTPESVKSREVVYRHENGRQSRWFVGGGS